MNQEQSRPVAEVASRAANCGNGEAIITWGWGGELVAPGGWA